MKRHPDYYPPWTSIAAYFEKLDALGKKRTTAFDALCRFVHEKKEYPTARELEDWAGEEYRGLARRLSELRDDYNVVRLGPARKDKLSGVMARTWIPEPDPDWQPKDKLKIFVVYEILTKQIVAICSDEEQAEKKRTAPMHSVVSMRLNGDIPQELQGVPLPVLPTVPSDPPPSPWPMIPIEPLPNLCSVCKIDLAKATHYCCQRPDCPSRVWCGDGPPDLQPKIICEAPDGSTQESQTQGEAEVLPDVQSGGDVSKRDSQGPRVEGILRVSERPRDEDSEST